MEIEQYSGETMILNMGPQHPSTHGVLRVVLKTDGEIIREADPVVGYLHRCFEKHAECVDYPGVIPFTDRMDYVAAMAQSCGFVLAVEKLAGIEVNERVRLSRVVMEELQRIASHLLSLGTFGMDMGAFTPFLHTFRERERILDLFEWVCGARLLYNYNWVGGLSHDLPEGFEAKCREFVDTFQPRIKELNDLLSFNKIFIERTATVGILSAETALDYAISGPNLRGSGVDWDVRRDETYLGYDGFDFQVCTGLGEFGPLGSCWDRYYVRVAEMEQSCEIIRQVLERIPATQGQDVQEALPKKVRPPVGEICHRTETPRGELTYYIVSDGSDVPYRVKVKSPCFVAVSALKEVSKDHMLADLVALVGAFDIVLGEVDR
jgi:NADH-quinone oxidoreductase subunit D